MSKYQKIIFVSLCCILFGNAAAEDICKDNESKSKYFPRTLIISNEISNNYCKGTLSSDILAGKALFRLWRETILDETNELTDIGIELTPYIEKLVTMTINSDLSSWPSFSVNSNVMTSGYWFNVDNSGLPKGEFTDVVNTRCEQKKSFKADCFTVLMDFQSAINTYKISAVLMETDGAKAKLKLYTSEWERYFTEARSQTFVELGFNSFLFKEEIKSPHFVLPPQHQWIVLHPNLLMEYIDEAENGSQFKAALAVEWFGINYWNWKVPFGASIMSTYSDRAGVSNTGVGFLFHIKNHYSIGVSKNSGEYAVSISIDFLKLFESRNKQIRKFNKYIGTSYKKSTS